MKLKQVLYYFIVVLLILLGACSPQQIAILPAVPPSEAPANSVIDTIDLVGPKMEVGSTFLYADGAVLVAVPAGEFTMGAAGPDNPQHQVNLSDFWIYSTKVTNGQYSYCVAMGLCTPLQFQANNPAFDDPLRSNDPMVGITYDQAASYCSFVHARLPTEAEWEKAARGPQGNIFPWGDGAPSCDLLNYGTCEGDTTSVTNYPAGRSYYQAFDMEGNALEWVADWYKADYYLNSPKDNPQGPEQGSTRSVRSSAFNSGANQTQAFNRFYSTADTQRNNLGFRCVVDIDHIDDFAPFCNYPAVYGTDGIGGANSGMQIDVSCPPLAINQFPACNGSTPSTNVSFSGLQGITYQGFTYSIQGACTPTGGLEFTCTGDAHLEICSECTVFITAPPQCPDGYSWDPDLNTCLGIGAPGECLPGSTYDSAGQCCTLGPETEAPTASPLSSGFTTNMLPHVGCPAGTWAYFSASGSGCVAVPVQSPFCASANVELLSCTGGGGGGPQGCPAQSCDVNYKWDPATCSCVCDGC
jgi:formylglycine-generating enzyme required for sulfatase activity